MANSFKCPTHCNDKSGRKEPVKNAVGSDEDSVKVGVFGNPLQFGDPPNIFRVGAKHIHGLCFN